MWIKTILMAVMGIGSGLIVSVGVFTVLLTAALIPRFAGKTHTGKHVKIYESAVILGVTLGNLVSIYRFHVPIGEIGIAFFGIFSGIFIGSFAIAIAEMLDGIPIFARRLNFRRGIGIVVLFMAIGKTTGALLYFYQRM